MTNATLKFVFGTEEFVFPVTWVDETILEGEEIAERVFFSGEFEKQWENCDFPEITIYSENFPHLHSQVRYEEMAGVLFPIKSHTE